MERGLERKQSEWTPEEALRESELRFRSVVESANDAVLLMNSSGGIVSMNPATSRIFGYDEELISKEILFLLPDRYHPMYNEILKKVLQEKNPSVPGETVEMYGVRKNGTEFPLELTLAYWKLGARVFLCATVHDISKRRNAESALLKKTALVQLLQEIAVASNEATNIEDAVGFAVNRICVFAGWPVGHVYFHREGSDAELYPSGIWHIEDADRYREFRKTTDQTILTKGMGVAGKVLQEGTPIWMDDVSGDLTHPAARVKMESGIRTSFAFPVLVETDVVAILEFFSDRIVELDEALVEIMPHIGSMLGRVFERHRAVTAVRLAEARMRKLVESIQAIVWRSDAQTFRLSFVSKEAEMILGYPTVEWLNDPEFWISHMHSEDREWAPALMANASAEMKDHSYDYRMIAKDGRTIWFRNVVRVLMENGEARELVGVMIDITAQKQFEEQLKQSQEQMRALAGHLQNVREEERTKVAREVHDDLGQVLTALKMDLSLLNRGMLESSANMPRFKLMEEIGSMRRLVDRAIHTVRRIATELRPEVLDYLDLKGAMEWQIQEFEGRSGIACEFRCNLENLDLDRERATALFRIFQEAMTNVARHARASRVNIGLRRQGRRLTMEVSDNGRGISETEATNSRSFGLLGMRERALLLGGEVDVRGLPGQGTTVTVQVSLPSNPEEGNSC